MKTTISKPTSVSVSEATGHSCEPRGVLHQKKYLSSVFNTGHLGFLAEQSVSEASTMVDRLISGDYTVESRSLLEGKGIGNKVKAGVSAGDSRSTKSQSYVRTPHR
nr:hypothetical protein [Duncaniella dubosii]